MPIADYDAETKAISDGERIRQIATEPVFDKAIKDLGVQYYQDFKTAATPDARLNAWSKAKALDDLLNQLRATAESGTIAKITREKREEAERRNQPRRVPSPRTT